MKEAKIFLLDLNPSSDVGSTLGVILESLPNLRVQLKHESPQEIKSALSDGELCSTILRSNSDLIFIVLSPSLLEQGRALLQAISNERLEMPIIVVPEACKPDEIFSLLKLGAADFITPPLKAIDILPRLWRLLEHKQLLLINDESKIGNEILAYLVDHPKTQDTLEGIVEWWLLERAIKYQEAQFETTYIAIREDWERSSARR